jgi:hypothetical protein
LAQEALRRSTPKPLRAHALRVQGAALFRVGDNAEAIGPLTEAYSCYDPERSTLAPLYQAYTGYFLAMAHGRSARVADGRSWLERADQHAHACRKAAEAMPPMSWIRRLTLELLQREAQSLLGVADAPGTAKPAEPPR